MSRENKERKRRQRRQRGPRDGAAPSAESASLAKSPPPPRREYTITTEALHDDLPANQPMEQIDETERERLFDLVQRDPQKAVEGIEALLARFPNTPTLLNWLTTAYTAAGEDEKADQTAEANFRANPDYLFARINFAQTCLARGELDRIDEIFGHKYDLKALYPQRDVFHLTEFTGFAGLMVAYFVKRGKLDVAKIYFNMLHRLAPRSRATQLAASMISGGALKRAAKGLYKRALRSGRLPTR